MPTLYDLAQDEMAILAALDQDGGDIDGPNVTAALKRYFHEDEIHELEDRRADLMDDGDTPEGEKHAHEEHYDRAMAEIGEKVERKVGNYLKLRATLDANRNARQQEAKRLLDLAKTDDATIRRLDHALQFAMEATGRKRIDSEHGKAWVQKNGGRRPVVMAEGVTVDDVPEMFRKVAVDFNRVAIYEALEHGGELPFATLGEAGYSLRVK